MVNGIDVSDWQPNVDWQAVHDAGYSFAYAKATEGTSYTASTFHDNVIGMQKAGMLCGAYHMYRFDQDPIAQAKHFLDVSLPQDGDLPPALDLELTVQSRERAISDVAKFLGIVEHATGSKMVLYMGYYFWQGALGGTDAFTGHPLWLAQYDYAAQEGRSSPQLLPMSSKGTWQWAFWQYTDKKLIPGVGAVDADWFNGSLEQLHALCLDCRRCG